MPNTTSAPNTRKPKLGLSDGNHAVLAMAPPQIAISGQPRRIATTVIFRASWDCSLPLTEGRHVLVLSGADRCATCMSRPRWERLSLYSPTLVGTHHLGS